MNERDKILARLENVAICMTQVLGERNFEYRLKILQTEIREIGCDIIRTLKSEEPVTGVSE